MAEEGKRFIDKRVFKSPIKDLIKVLTSNGYKLQTTVLRDGTYYVYNTQKMLRSFRYYGGYRLYDLKLNTKNYIDKEIHDCLVLYDRVSRESSKLKGILDSMYPNARENSYRMKHAFEWSFIENGLRDTSVGFEVKWGNEWRLDVMMVHIEHYFSCSFSYYPQRGSVENVFLRYRKKQKDVRVKRILVPDACKFLFDDLIVSMEDGTLKGIE